MTYDQRFASRRTDVLTYETEPLEKAVTIAGPVTPVLRRVHFRHGLGFHGEVDRRLSERRVRSRAEPEGRAHGRLPADGARRAVPGEVPQQHVASRSPFVPGEPAKIEFAMPDVLHTFLPGHRIMVQIQSTWFPLADRNPQKFRGHSDGEGGGFQEGDGAGVSRRGGGGRGWRCWRLSRSARGWNMGKMERLLTVRPARGFEAFFGRCRAPFQPTSPRFWVQVALSTVKKRSHTQRVRVSRPSSWSRVGLKSSGRHGSPGRKVVHLITTTRFLRSTRLAADTITTGCVP